MIGVILLTYSRLEYAQQTLDALAVNLYAPEPVWLHIADDGSSQEYRDSLWKLAKVYWGENVSMTNSERGGYGASYNLSTQLMHKVCDLFLPLEDDWQLIRPLDLSPMVEVLRAGNPEARCIRLGYLGYTQELRGKFFWASHTHWLALDPASSEPHVFSGHPRLETLEFQRAVGPWPEGLSAGETEFRVAHRPEARKGVVWPVELVNPAGDAFVHIGAVNVKDAPLLNKKEVVV